MSDSGGVRIMIDSQQASEALIRYRPDRASCPSVADLQSRQPDHDPVGRAGIRRQYRDLALALGRLPDLDFGRCDRSLWRRWRSARSAIPAPACARSMSGCWWRICCFFAFGYFCSSASASFTPRQQGTFWPIYFMLVYSIAGLWFGYAFVAIGVGITCADPGRLFLHRRGISAVDGVRQWRRPDPGRALDASDLTDG